MIKIKRPSCPEELTNRKQELTERYKLSKSVGKEDSVWRQRFITEPLLSMSNSKCVYCECLLNEEGKYLQVEHYYPKSLFEDEVVDWDNLLPVCGRCNTKKGNYNTKISPIINPTTHDPKEHLHLCMYEFSILGSDEMGENTEYVLDLNDQTGLHLTRFRISREVIKEIKEFHYLLSEYDPNVADRRKERSLKRKIKNVLNNALPNIEYSATVASVLLAYPRSNELIDLMFGKGIWDDELTSLYATISENALPIRNALPQSV